MATILVEKETKRVKYMVGEDGHIALFRDIAVIEYPDGTTEIAGDLNRNNAQIINDVTLPEGFVGDKFDYIEGTFVPVPEPEDQV